MQRIVVFVMAICIATSAIAADENVKLANIEKNIRPGAALGSVVPQVSEQYEYYDIIGQTEKELRRQMSEYGIKWDDGKTYDALTTWSVKWNYGYSTSTAGCMAQPFNATVDITFRYPRWIRGDAAVEPLAAKWDSYMNNLIVHENGHRDMAIQHTADFAAVAAELVAPSCADLDRQIESLGRERMAKLNSEERDYDTTTIHGATQGAVFP